MRDVNHKLAYVGWLKQHHRKRGRYGAERIELDPPVAEVWQAHGYAENPQAVIPVTRIAYRCAYTDQEDESLLVFPVSPKISL